MLGVEGGVGTFFISLRILNPPMEGFEPVQQGCIGPQNDASFEGPVILRALGLFK